MGDRGHIQVARMDAVLMIEHANPPGHSMTWSLIHAEAVPALRDDLAPHDERVADGAIYRVERDPDEPDYIVVARYLTEDDTRPEVVAERPTYPANAAHIVGDARAGAAWARWWSVLAGLGLRDVE